MAKKLVDGFIVAKKDRKFLPKPIALERALRKIEFYTDEELRNVPTGSIFVFDAEVYRNFFYVAFKNVLTGKYVSFEQSPDCELDATKLRWMLWRFLVVGFNSENYDIPILTYAVSGKTCEQIKDMSDWMFENGKDERGIPKKIPRFLLERQMGMKIPTYNHVDVMEVAPLKGSLKLYAGRLAARRMQDLPYEPSHILSQTEAAVVRPYCCNDLDNTELVAKEVWPAVMLRADMSKQYGIDLRSKSDAQVAEAVFNAEIKKITGWSPQKVAKVPDDLLQYYPPPEIKFRTPELQQFLEFVKTLRFSLDGLGSPIAPLELKERETIYIGGKPYTFSMGGLHSNEKKEAHFADDEWLITDTDVESFYPRIILNQKLFPRHLGMVWLEVFDILVNRRLDAKAKAKACKKAGDREGEKLWKQIADSLKITINGSFGKLGDRWSTIYAPQLMLQVTLSGQLYLMMAIERLAMANIEVIQANTDGIVAKYRKSEREWMQSIFGEWEKDTGFKTEETHYLGLFSKDVNNYIALKEEGDPEARFVDQQLGFKGKGEYCERGSAGDSLLSRNPESIVCVDAVMHYLKTGRPIEETIKAETKFERFLSIANVRGGGEKDGYYLGKVVRWYYRNGEHGCISYVGSGNKVQLTDGACPTMDLPETTPSDIDYNWYIKSAKKMLYSLGVYKVPKTATLF